MRRQRYLRLFVTGAGAFLVILGLAPASASSANISHSYQSTTGINNGSIVSLDPQRSNYVQPANTNNGARLLGVAVASGDSLLAVDPTTGAIQVATSGNVNTIVSTIDGDIKVGDQVAVSPFNGVGMKAMPGSSVIGLAQTAFNSKSSGATTQQVKDKSGKTSQVDIGYIRVSIAITTDPLGTDASGLKKVAVSLTGHQVSTTRIALSIAVAAVELLSLIVLIYASIYSSIVSIGRNPLAKYAVFRTLASVLGVAALTTVVAGIIIFFLLH